MTEPLALAAEAPPRLVAVGAAPSFHEVPVTLPPLAPAVRGLTVIVPAYNEAACIGDTLRSLLLQSVSPDRIIVVDDASTDGTGDVARSFGVTVLRPPGNTGSKAGAQNVALGLVETELTLALDADTTLEPDALERILSVFDDSRVAAACGFVVPRIVRTLWERGRYIEYLYAFTFCKQVQDYYERPLIASGCFSAYRTAVLREEGGWSTRTLAEDMDLTWSLYEHGHRVRFVPEAVCYPVEPRNFLMLRRQLRRWSHGFVQNLALHWRGILQIPYLRSAVSVALWDATVSSLAFLLLVPILALFVNPLFLLAYVMDAAALFVPVAAGALARHELGRALVSLPSFFVLRPINGAFFLAALVSELVLRRSLRVYEKGH